MRTKIRFRRKKKTAISFHPTATAKTSVTYLTRLRRMPSPGDLPAIRRTLLWMLPALPCCFLVSAF
ncbi:hypothetical protein MUK42_36034 [Musa troglodytarum]|uniref:Uncharacterized protein n=1 Tax=Musa troglodytarum TaxID=320322 RepID=A0A9E7K8B5_9LILI|nr:hypothetical protein MUK42_36034 [Musa troglodytarum]